jgi:SAM-dependent methyltransferase
MKRVHLCCGSVYLKGYENCDIVGDVLPNYVMADGIAENPNETTLENYFKRPFEKDSKKRERPGFIIDTQMNILEKWPWDDRSVDEIVMVNGFEHFEPNTELKHVIKEIERVLRVGGMFLFDFPDIKEIVNQYHDTDPHFCMELIYCNRKNKYSVHPFGYTYKTIPTYLTPDKWEIYPLDVVKHDYPSLGVHALRIAW